MALHICGMILLVLWDGHLARPLYFRALVSPTLQESSLDSATPLDKYYRHSVELVSVSYVAMSTMVASLCGGKLRTASPRVVRATPTLF